MIVVEGDLQEVDPVAAAEDRRLERGTKTESDAESRRAHPSLAAAPAAAASAAAVASGIAAARARAVPSAAPVGVQAEHGGVGDRSAADGDGAVERVAQHQFLAAVAAGLDRSSPSFLRTLLGAATGVPRPARLRRIAPSRQSPKLAAAAKINRNPTLKRPAARATLSLKAPRPSTMTAAGSTIRLRRSLAIRKRSHCDEKGRTRSATAARKPSSLRAARAVCPVPGNCSSSLCLDAAT